jgi:hypothetical protein
MTKKLLLRTNPPKGGEGWKFQLNHVRYYIGESCNNLTKKKYDEMLQKWITMCVNTLNFIFDLSHNFMQIRCNRDNLEPPSEYFEIFDMNFTFKSSIWIIDICLMLEYKFFWHYVLIEASCIQSLLQDSRVTCSICYFIISEDTVNVQRKSYLLTNFCSYTWIQDLIFKRSI